MSLYTDDDLRGFVKYTREYMSKLEIPPDKDELDKVEELIRIIITMRFNSMVFESFVKGHSAKEYILSEDLNQLPLHMNDEGLLSQVIIKWRLNNNK